MKPEPLPLSTAEAGARLRQLATARGVSLAELSRMIRQRDRYLEVFVREGHPARLPADARRLLALFLKVPEWELGEIDG
ncbi:hypothetical protein BH10PSE14_BH10PSE14_07010 [soil metagenome]